MTEDDKVLGQLELLKRGLDTPGPASPLSAQREQTLLDAALLQHGAAPLAGKRGLRVAVAVALVAIGAAAALGVWRLGGSPASQRPAPQPSADGARAPQQPGIEPAQGTAAPQAVAPAAVGPIEAAPAPALRAAPSPSGDAAKEVDLLKQANDLRRSGDFSGAEQLYRQVIQRYPQTSSGYVAMSSVASLVMNRDPAGAVEMYRAARRARPTGALDLEIRQGLARGYRKLGQAAAERRELEELVARYPGAEASARAKTRLAELSGASPR